MVTLNELWTNLHLQKVRPIDNDEGKNSKVWIVHDTQLDEQLVLKEITKQSLENQSIQDFFLEAKLLNYGDHPHIMPIRHASEDDENIYITMPYYKEGSLQSKMDNKMLTVGEIIKYALDFLNGLLFIHVKEMIHLDIKPSNVIINDKDRALLTDFGLSRYLEMDGFANQPMQYKAHRSPESFIIQDRTILDDIYQAGITMYRLCNGDDVFYDQFENMVHKHGGSSHEIYLDLKRGKFPDRNFYLPHIPSKLRNIINKAMHYDSEKRYKSILELVNALSKIDENLKWEYTVDRASKGHIWYLDKTNEVKVTITCNPNGNNWITEGIKESPKQTINLKAVSGNFDNQQAAFNHVKSVLSRNL